MSAPKRDPICTVARRAAVAQGHRLSRWRAVPLPEDERVWVCRCLACGADVVCRPWVPLFSRQVEGTALDGACPGGTLIPSRASTRPSSDDVHEVIAQTSQQFAHWMAQVVGPTWRTDLPADAQRAAAKRWVHGRTYGTGWRSGDMAKKQG